MNNVLKERKPKSRKKIINIKPLLDHVESSWSKIAPLWPLENIIAVNPLSGFEDIPFKDALDLSESYFCQKDLPLKMLDVNRETIKWLQIYFDYGQATISMPLREEGLLRSVATLLRYDNKIFNRQNQSKEFLDELLESNQNLLYKCLTALKIPHDEQEYFLTLMLTTLPGWAAHIKYLTDWSSNNNTSKFGPINKTEYLELRLILTLLIWPEASELLAWHKNLQNNNKNEQLYKSICNNERNYNTKLLNNFRNIKHGEKIKKADAQLVFCIDVRSEPFRRAIETTGNYETYGFAGFFGLPVEICNATNEDSYASCPVLIKPSYKIEETPIEITTGETLIIEKKSLLKKIYQSLKYSFVAPFTLVETIGLGAGGIMTLKCFSPKVLNSIKQKIENYFKGEYYISPNIDSIPLDLQVTHAAQALKIIGLNNNFASLIIFCGHGSKTTNNAFESSLDCGACGGRHGGPNARILAKILNCSEVRNLLKKNHQLNIPNDTYFLAGEHNTTTDEFDIFDHDASQTKQQVINNLKTDLQKARIVNNSSRLQNLTTSPSKTKSIKAIYSRSNDWSEIRPEWGLAKNASFIVGPRWLTEGTNLEGRSFLHSYNWELDEDKQSLRTIMTAPMIVGQWINAQYLFSTLNNIAFGGGSKVTKNITGKIGIMQGNASDLMSGLPLQSVYKNDREPYHEVLRLSSVIYAPKEVIREIVSEEPVLQKLVSNDWIHIFSIDPKENNTSKLLPDLTWEIIE